MGVRFFTLQMIPMCFHLTSNHVSSRVQLQPDDDDEERYQRKVGGKRPVVGNIKVVKSDGLVKIYNKPVDVSELLKQFPKHLVCASDSFYIGQKIPALSEHDQLQLGQKYFLLPKHLFQSVLSFVTIASFASSGPESEPDQKPSPVIPSINSKNAFLRKAATCEPFHIQKSETGCLRIRVSDEFISQLLEEGKLRDESKVEEDDDEHSKSFESNNKVCTTPQLQKDYSQLVGSKQWKPRLEPIRETRETKRRSRLSSFGMRKSKKKSQPSSSSKATQSFEDDVEHSKSIEAKNKVCTTPQLQKDYSQLVGSRQWKPRLEPIREIRETKRRSRLSSFGMRRTKKKSLPGSSSKATQSTKSSKSSKSPKSPKVVALVKSEHHSKAKSKIKSSKK